MQLATSFIVCAASVNTNALVGVCGESKRNISVLQRFWHRNRPSDQLARQLPIEVAVRAIDRVRVASPFLAA